MLNRRQFFSTAALAGSALAGIVPTVKAAAPAADVTTKSCRRKRIRCF